jgi:hypothetical protein
MWRLKLIGREIGIIIFHAIEVRNFLIVEYSLLDLSIGKIKDK